MENHLKEVSKRLMKQNRLLQKVPILMEDIDAELGFIPPFCEAAAIDDVKLIIIGQDPTIRNKNSREDIEFTLNLDKNGSMKKYIEPICKKLNVDIQKEVYATNLFKCFFEKPPADDERILHFHFKYWMDFLMQELEPFKNIPILTLGEPLVRLLMHSGKKKVNHYWDYTGQTTSGENFSQIKAEHNYLQRDIYPLPHQRIANKKGFYKTYFNDYLHHIKMQMP